VKRSFKPVSGAYPQVDRNRKFFRHDMIDAMTAVDKYLLMEFTRLLPDYLVKPACGRIPDWRQELDGSEIGRIVGFMEHSEKQMGLLSASIYSYGTQVNALRRACDDKKVTDAELRATRLELAVSIVALQRTMAEVFEGAKERADEKPRRPD